MVVHTCSPSYLGGWNKRIDLTWANITPQHSSLATEHDYVSKKYICKNLPGMVAHPGNPSNSGGWGGRIAWTREAEVAVSRDCAIALQPGKQEWNSVSKRKKKEKEKEKKVEMYYILIGVFWFIQLSKLINLYLKWIFFTVYKLYVNKVDFSC